MTSLAYLFRTRQSLWKHPTALFIFLSIVTVLCIGSGATLSGYQIYDDYEILEIQSYLNQGHGYWDTVGHFIGHNDYNRIRHRYIGRVAQVMLFGTNIVWFRIALFLMCLITIMSTYLFFNKWGFRWPESVLFTLFTYVGGQMQVWWNLLADENAGMFYLSLSLLCMVMQKKAFNIIFVICVSLMSFSKESFTVIVPAILYLKVWHTHRSEQIGWIGSLRTNIRVITAVLGILLIQSAIIIFHTGTFVGDFDGVNTVSLFNLAPVFWKLLAITLGGWPGLAMLFFACAHILKQKRDAAFFKDVAFSIIFFLMAIIPIVYLFSRQGFDQARYLLPASLIFGFTISPCGRPIGKDALANFCRWAGLGLIVFYLGFSFLTAWDEGCLIKRHSQDIRNLIRTVEKLTTPDDMILKVVDPADDIETSYALNCYLESFANRKNVYCFPIFRGAYTNLRKRLLSDRYYFNVARIHKNTMFSAIRDLNKIRTIIVCPYRYLPFYIASKSWFKPSQYRSLVIGEFTIFYRAGPQQGLDTSTLNSSGVSPNGLHRTVPDVPDFFSTESETKIRSDTLGWSNRANCRIIRNPNGYGYFVRYSTGYEGFRLYGNPETPKKKIFVIGDSFTDAVTAGDGKTYYHYLNSHLDNTEVFAYGCSGYSSLQEYLILDAYIDRIRPDLILWQFAGNDLVNNEHELESLSDMNKYRITRPYWIGGKIELRYPARIPRWLYEAYYRFRFFRQDAMKRDPVQTDQSCNAIKKTLTPDDPLYRRALQTTSEIMSMVKKRAHKVPVVAFNANETAWIDDAVYGRICNENRIIFIPGIAKLIEEGRDRGYKVDGAPHDFHWSAIGHTIVGKRILNFLTKKRSVEGLRKGFRSTLQIT